MENEITCYLCQGIRGNFLLSPIANCGQKYTRSTDLLPSLRDKDAESAVPSVRFSSVQLLDRLGRRGEMRDDSVEIAFRSFLHEANVSCSGMDSGVYSLTLSIQHYFLCRTTASPTLQGALTNGFCEVVMARGLPVSCEFSSSQLPEDPPPRPEDRVERRAKIKPGFTICEAPGEECQSESCWPSRLSDDSLMVVVYTALRLHLSYTSEDVGSRL